jgi:ABC-type sugar transport system substrate-binding protein
VNVIVAACENKDPISTALKKAQAAGIKVITYDADAQPDARSFFVNQATAQAIGEQLTGSEGEFAIITGSLTSSNMNEWIKHLNERQAKYPNMKLVDIKPCDDQKDKA